jgi:putative membrane protein
MGRYSSRSDTFFTEEERERIKVTTIGVEARTIGEVATVVVDRSGDYPEAEVTGSIFMGSLASLLLSTVFFHDSIWAFIPFAFLLSVPSRLLFRKVPALKVGLISKGEKDKAVWERAIRTFYERGLYKTKKHTGVLFLLSLLERKVVVLADKGIHGKIPQGTLNRFADMVSKGVQEGKACDALCDAIMAVGNLLWEYHPITDADTDELPNVVMYEESSETRSFNIGE